VIVIVDPWQSVEGGAEIETAGLTVVTTAMLFVETGDIAQLT
jgi:hypothetical protein